MYNVKHVLCRLIRVECVCSCLTQLILFDGRGVFTLLPKVGLHVSALDNSHFQVVRESLKSSYTRFNMGYVRVHLQPEDGYCQELKHAVVP